MLVGACSCRPLIDSEISEGCQTCLGVVRNVPQVKGSHDAFHEVPSMLTAVVLLGKLQGLHQT